MNRKSHLFLTIAGILILTAAQIIEYSFDLSDTGLGLMMGVGIGLLLLPIIKKIKFYH